VFDSMAVLEQRKSLEELRKNHGLGLVKNGADLDRARTQDFSLDLVYSLWGLDGISEISDLEKLWTGGFRIFRPVWAASNKIAVAADDPVEAESGRTELGREILGRGAGKNLVLDLTNVGARAMEEFLANRRGKNWLVTLTRNLEENLLREIAEKHGVVSLSFALAHFAEDAAENFLVEKIGALRNLVGDDHLVLGTELHGLRADRVVPGQQRVAGLAIFEEKLVTQFGAKFAEKFLWGTGERILRENLG